MKPLLITYEEFQSFRDVGKKVTESKILDCIEIAQQVDLFDVLGEFLFDVIDNKESSTYSLLMNGGTWVASDGKNWRHSGLKSLLSDYAYIRYIEKLNQNITPFGITQKITQDSQPVERNTLRDMIKQNQKDADVKFRLINEYLLDNPSLFSRYCQGNIPSINSYSQNFSKIERTPTGMNEVTNAEVKLGIRK